LYKKKENKQIYAWGETIYKTSQKHKIKKQNKKIYRLNGDNITLIFNVSSRWMRWVRLMLPADLPPGGMYPSVRWTDTKAGLGRLENNKFIIYVAFKPRTVQPVV
jgi:hypothetical protein